MTIARVSMKWLVVGLVALVGAAGCSDSRRISQSLNPLPPPLSIKKIDPVSGPIAGGTLVTITGTSFPTAAGALTVTFGGTSATAVSVTSANTLVATAPASAAGPVDVVLTIVASGATATEPSGYTFVGVTPPAPTVGGIAASSGGINGGTLVTITGSGFRAGATVTIGGSAATNVTVLTGGRLTCFTPAGTAGAVSVVVTNTDAQAGTLTAGFVYLGGATPNPAPTVNSVNPTSGPFLGGTSVTITGANFLTIGGVKPTVTFGTVNAASVTVVHAGLLVAVTAPSPSGTVGVTVTNPDSQSGTALSAFTFVIPAPVISAINPANGPATLTNTVTITGANFFTGVTVTFGGTAATITSTASFRLIVTAPTGTGTVTVRVTNTDSQFATTTYTYNPVPTCTAITPTSGPSSGGTAVTLTGTGFLSGATVRIGTATATSVVVVSATQITAVTAAGPGGAQNVTVTNPDTQAGTAVGAFTYILPTPTITAITPTNGPATLTATVTITGTNFFSGATVTFGGVAATVTSTTSTQLVVTAPTGTGTVTVRVTNPDAQFATTTYTYNPAPTFTAIAPTSGTSNGGTAITLTGTGFLAGATVLVGSSTATSVVVVSATQITAVTPAGPAGAQNVRVTNPDGQSATLASAYTYVPPPTVSTIAPAFSPAAGGTLVTITGTGFQAGATASLGGSNLSGVTVTPPSTITGTTTAHVVGQVNVVVTNPDTQTGTLLNGFTYSNTPTVTAVNPTTGFSSGGTAATITGTNFMSGATVAFGGTSATSVVFVNSTTITCVTPAHAVGLVSIVVTNPGGFAGTGSNLFTYNFGPNDQTLAFVWDTSAGIDSKRRWYIDFSFASFTADLSAVGLQTGTPADSINAYARDWMRAYALQNLNVVYGRNPDGTKVSGTSINITFVGLPPGAGTPGGSGASDYSRICVGGCTPNVVSNSCNGTGTNCNSGTVGRASFDFGNPCGDSAENNCNASAYGGTGCLGVFATNIKNLIFSPATLSPALAQATDLQYLDGTTNSGARYDAIHNYMKRFARRIGYVADHEIGHSLGLCGSALTGSCNSAAGQCLASNSHNACCSTNIMIDVVSFGSDGSTPISNTAKAFSGQGVSAASTCWSNLLFSSWSMLQSYVGTSP